VPQYSVGGGPDFISEVARVVQAGYRGQPLPNVSYAMTGWYSEYARLRTLEPGVSGPGAVFLNKADGTTYGLELSGTWSVTPRWRLSAGHVYQHLEIRLAPDSHDIGGSTGLANNDPAHWSSLRSSWDLRDDLELDLDVRRVGALPRPAVPAYTAASLRIGWRARRGLELSLQAQNLGADDHPEFGAAPNRPVYDRQLAARATWRF
jgi:iron complex outermembrane receptor protein